MKPINAFSRIVLFFLSLLTGRISAFEKVPIDLDRRGSSSLMTRSAAAFALPALEKVNSFYKTKPYVAAFLTCSIKAVAADALVQTDESRGEANTKKFDKMRNLAFMLYGGFYQGGAQEYIFNRIYPALFGAGNDFGPVAKTVLFHNFVTSPILTLPMLYLIKGALLKNNFTQSIERYKSDVLNDGLLFKYWRLWLTVDFIAFKFVPRQFLISFIAMVSFFWLLILSKIAGKNNSSPAPATETA